MAVCVMNVDLMRDQHAVANCDAAVRPNMGLLTNKTPFSDRNITSIWKGEYVAANDCVRGDHNASGVTVWI